MGGRGVGKTEAGAQGVREWARSNRFVDIVGPTSETTRNILVEGPSGIMAVCPNAERPDYSPSLRTMTWPSGCKTRLLSADEPERIRGSQREKVWADELCAWRNPKEALDQILLGLRLGANPQICITTTPRPLKVLKDLLANPHTVVTRGATELNRANLSPYFYSQIISRYSSTRLARQELQGELLEDVIGALWTWEMLDRNRLAEIPKDARIVRSVVAIDPAVSAAEDSDETGIVVCSMDDRVPAHFYVTEDASGKYSPDGWARRAIQAYYGHDADRIVAETNQGGQMVEATIHHADANVAYRGVHASKNKVARAEPIAALYEQGRIHHIGSFPESEDQQTTFVQGSSNSPDRLDALVWAMSDLSEGSRVLGLVEFLKGCAEKASSFIFGADTPELSPRANLEKAAAFEVEKKLHRLTSTQPETWKPELVPACPACSSTLTVRISKSQCHCNMCATDYFPDAIATIARPARTDWLRTH
jgi:phage terminase large subunit-like protein